MRSLRKHSNMFSELPHQYFSISVSMGFSTVATPRNHETMELGNLCPVSWKPYKMTMHGNLWKLWKLTNDGSSIHSDYVQLLK